MTEIRANVSRWKTRRLWWRGGRRIFLTRLGSRMRSATRFPMSAISRSFSCRRKIFVVPRVSALSFGARSSVSTSPKAEPTSYRIAPSIAHRITTMGSGLTVTTDLIRLTFSLPSMPPVADTFSPSGRLIGSGEASRDGFRRRSEPRSTEPRRRRWRCADRSRDGRLLL